MDFLLILSSRSNLINTCEEIVLQAMVLLNEVTEKADPAALIEIVRNWLEKSQSDKYSKVTKIMLNKVNLPYIIDKSMTYTGEKEQDVQEMSIRSLGIIIGDSEAIQFFHQASA